LSAKAGKEKESVKKRSENIKNIGPILLEKGINLRVLDNLGRLFVAEMYTFDMF
jgi:hypothetical protein